MMKIINGTVFTEAGQFEKKTLYFSDGRFTTRREEPEQVIDAQGKLILPGLTDCHLHGCLGEDVSDAKPGALDRIARYEAHVGVTQMLPATMTLPHERLKKIFRLLGESEPKNGALFAGIHMEGPYLSEKKLGAQNPKYIAQAQLEMFQAYQELAQGKIRILSIAPEKLGALDFIRKVASQVTVSLAHTETDYDTAKAAFEAGARQLTHMFNAMPGMHHRNPGPIPAALEADHVRPELIADGIHIHPAMIRLSFKLFGRDRMILVSDSMRATGLGDGRYDLGGQDVLVRGNRAEIPGVSIAGSVTPLIECVRIAIKCGVPMEDAILAASHNPAKNVGIWDQVGSISPGKLANFLITDSQLNIEQVYIQGKKFQ